MPRKNLTEAGAQIIEAKSDGSLLVQVITPGWGSSGYYSAEVLQEAAKTGVWVAGTHCYFNHPSASESVDRPERDVRDLAATLVEDARWDGQRLVARIQPVGLGKTVLADEAFRKAVGVSVRASADIGIGEAEGRKGAIVQEIFADTFNSVDLVTHAGRGGMILEAARRASEATANDTERAIQDAVSAAYNDQDNETYSWVKDYDPDKKVAYFEVSTAGVCATYSQSFTVSDSGDVELVDDRVEVNQRTEYVPAATTEAAPPNVPVHPAGQSTITKEHTMPEIEEGATVSVQETRLRTLEADAGRVPLLESERDTARTALAEARQELAVEKAKTYARQFGTDRVRDANSELDPTAVDRIVVEAMRTIPLTEGDDQRLDTEAFGKQVDTARVAEETYLATVIKNRGGSVQGLGQTDGTPQVTEGQVDNIVAGAFGRKTVKGA